MRPRQNLEHNPERRCSVCGVKHHRKHAWCADCMGGYMSGEHEPARRYATKSPKVGAPPPPPPGFNPSDFKNGRPVL